MKGRRSCSPPNYTLYNEGGIETIMKMCSPHHLKLEYEQALRTWKGREGRPSRDIPKLCVQIILLSQQQHGNTATPPAWNVVVRSVHQRKAEEQHWTFQAFCVSREINKLRWSSSECCSILSWMWWSCCRLLGGTCCPSLGPSSTNTTSLFC